MNNFLKKKSHLIVFNQVNSWTIYIYEVAMLGLLSFFLEML